MNKIKKSLLLLFATINLCSCSWPFNKKVAVLPISNYYIPSLLCFNLKVKMPGFNRNGFNQFGKYDSLYHHSQDITYGYDALQDLTWHDEKVEEFKLLYISDVMLKDPLTDNLEYDYLNTYLKTHGDFDFKSDYKWTFVGRNPIDPVTNQYDYDLPFIGYDFSKKDSYKEHVCLISCESDKKIIYAAEATLAKMVLYYR